MPTIAAKWILILTLYVDGGYDGGPALATAEFDSRAACLAAGDEWLKKAATIRGHVDHKTALCVEKGGR